MRICQRCGIRFPYEQKTNVRKYCSTNCAELSKYNGGYKLTRLQKDNCLGINQEVARLVRADVRRLKERNGSYLVVERCTK